LCTVKSLASRAISGRLYSLRMTQYLDRPFQSCYIRSMTEIAARDLRNSTADVLRRAESGEEIIITVKGRQSVRLVPVQREHRRWYSAAELVSKLRHCQADPGLRDYLAKLPGNTIEDLGPIQ
jgi:prevent-host-death family protein